MDIKFIFQATCAVCGTTADLEFIENDLSMNEFTIILDVPVCVTCKAESYEAGYEAGRADEAAEWNAERSI